MPDHDIIHGDCYEVLGTLAPDSFDAIVTDPPSGISFMGAEWDNLRGYEARTPEGKQLIAMGAVLGLESWEMGFVAFIAEVMKRAVAALKPGGHALVWALPRTSDLTALALRVAGLEIRDSFHQVYSSGFPKSFDVARGIDAHHGIESKIAAPADGKARNEGATYRSGLNISYGNRTRYEYQTEDARKWAGFGTALKPAHEVWWIARKPLIGTLAENLIAHGTGALNIDASRIGETPRFNALKAKPSEGWGHSGGGQSGGTAVSGRWPPNMGITHAPGCEPDKPCAPECPALEIDKQSGYSKSQPTGTPTPRKSVATDFQMKMSTQSYYEDEGGASRFFPCFYVPKPKASEKAAGLEENNPHPTVKAVELMRWLARLVTPPKGRILDPFAGSGSTGVASALEGFGFLGIEREAGFVDVGRRRIAHALQAPAGLLIGPGRPQAEDADQLRLFGE